MGLVRTGESDYDKEVAKWDTPKRLGGYGPDGFEAFPMMVYKAFRRDDGKVLCGDPAAFLSTDPVVQLRAEAFTSRCQRTVMSDEDLRAAMADGWCHTAKEAVEWHERWQQDIARAAAEAAHRLQTMSGKAQREHAFLDASTEAPVTDVPAPKRKPGRPAKVA